MLQFRLRASQSLALAIAALIAVPHTGLAQTPAKPATEQSVMQKIDLLFVQNSTGMEYDKAKGTLRMKNVGASTLFFTDRPVRMAGHYHTRDEFLPLSSEGPDSFAKNPPNATLSIVEASNPDLMNAVVELRNPRMNGNDLVYDIKVVEGTVPQAAGAAVLFIDIFGIWRRHIRRGQLLARLWRWPPQAQRRQLPPRQKRPRRQGPQHHPPAPPPQPATTQKLEQLKGLLNEGLITQAQYQKASQEVLNEMVK